MFTFHKEGGGQTGVCLFIPIDRGYIAALGQSVFCHKQINDKRLMINWHCQTLKHTVLQYMAALQQQQQQQLPCYVSQL